MSPIERMLSRESPEPLYRQLAANLEHAIRSGALKPGDRLQSEGELTRHFKVSRITVRQALEDLARQAIIVRKQGKGTFVREPAVRHDLKRLHGLLGSLFAQSETASARLLRYELGVPPADVRPAMRLRAGARALALDRLYLVGGRPIALARGWLAPAVAALPRAKAELLSTEDLMRAAGIRIACSQVSIRAEAAGTTARILKISARAPLLVLRREAFDREGIAREIGRVWFRSDAYELVCSSREQNAFAIRTVAEHA